MIGLFFQGTIENNRCSTALVDPKTIFEPFVDPKKSPMGPKIVKNYPKTESKSKVKIEEII